MAAPKTADKTAAMTIVTRLGESDWERLRAVRLRALRDAPDAYGSSVEREEGHDEATWRAMVARGAWWVAVCDARDVGVVAGGDREHDGERWVYSMWVEATRRGTGDAVALLDAVVRWALEQGASSLGLDVTDRVPRARRFYERYGFAATGVVFALPRDRSITLTEMRLGLSDLSGSGS